MEIPVTRWAPCKACAFRPCPVPSSCRGAAAAQIHRARRAQRPGGSSPGGSWKAPGPGSRCTPIPPSPSFAPRGTERGQRRFPGPAGLPADLQAEQAGVEEILRLLQLAQLLAGRRLVELGPAQLRRLQGSGLARGGPLPTPRRGPGPGRGVPALRRRLRRALRREDRTVRTPRAPRAPPHGPHGHRPPRPRRRLTAMAATTGTHTRARKGPANHVQRPAPCRPRSAAPHWPRVTARGSYWPRRRRPAFPPRPRSVSRLSGRGGGAFPRFAAGREGRGTVLQQLRVLGGSAAPAPLGWVSPRRGSLTLGPIAGHRPRLVCRVPPPPRCSLLTRAPQASGWLPNSLGPPPPMVGMETRAASAGCLGPGGL